MEVRLWTECLSDAVLDAELQGLRTKWGVTGTVPRDCNTITGTLLAYSTRATGGWSGAVMRVRRVSDHTETDVWPNGAGGLQTAAAAGTDVVAWAAGAAVRVVRWYNQGTAGADADLLIPDVFPLWATYGREGWRALPTRDNQPVLQGCPTFSNSGCYLLGTKYIDSLFLWSNFTVHLWVKMGASNPTYGFLFSLGNQRSWDLHCYGDRYSSVGQTASPFPVNTWAHVAFTRTGDIYGPTNTIRIWLNGTVMYTSPTNSSFAAPGCGQNYGLRSLVMGGLESPLTSRTAFDGKITDFVVVKDAVLDIAALYAGLTAPTY
jgi:hypothetical protein